MKNLPQTNWVEVKVTMVPAMLENCSADFFAIGCQGIKELESEAILYFDEAGWTGQLSKKIDAIVRKFFGEDMELSMAVKHFPAEDWNEKWKENFRTFHLGKTIVIRPEWENYQPQEREQVVIINPKMAFGTGHHETTYLVLEQMESMDITDKMVMDAGTGSAILGIYAALRGAKKVMAFDNDPVAIENAHENAGLNNMAVKMDIRCCDLHGVDPQPYDIILANINRNVLLALSDVFNQYAKAGTQLILSGLLETDVNDVSPVYKKSGWDFIRQTGQGEWMCMVWQASPSR